MNNNKKTKKITIGIVAILLFLILATSIFLIVYNWKSIKAGLNGEMLWTKDQVEELVDNAYKEGVGQGDAYKDIIDELTSNLALAQKAITTLTSERDQARVDVLDKSQRIETLETSNAGLQLAKQNLEEVRDRLIAQGQADTIIINNLNNSITELNKQIDIIKQEKQALVAQINELNATIETKNNDIEYYQLLLQAYENSNKIIVTIKTDKGKVLGVQTIDSGTCPVIENPTNTENETFLYWTLNGVEVNPNTISVTTNTTFIAVFDRSYTATFVYEEIETNVKVQSGNIANYTIPTDTVYKKFLYFTVNGNQVDYLTYPITANTRFVAKIAYNYDAIFKVDAETINSQIVKSGDFATMPTDPFKDDYLFEGWTINGSDLVNIEATPITANTTFIAKFLIDTKWDGTTYDTSWFTKDKTEYTLTTAAQFAGLKQVSTEQNRYLAGITIKLGNDICLNSKYLSSDNLTNRMQSIPGFAGTLVGQGYTIYGFKSESNAYNGLFMQVYENAEVIIKNLNFKNTYISTNSNITGGLIGKVNLNAIVTIENVKFDGQIINNDSKASETSKIFTGGLIGQNYYGKIIIKNCEITGTLLGRSIGGLISSIYGGTVTIDNCLVDATFIANANAIQTSARAAGFVGIDFKSDLVNITNSNVSIVLQSNTSNYSFKNFVIDANNNTTINITDCNVIDKENV